MKLLRSLLLRTAITGLQFSPSAQAATSVTTLVSQEQSVDTITQPNGAQIERGTTQLAARRQLGVPQKALTPDLWIYYGYRATGAAENPAHCDTLVVAFRDGKVSELKLVTPATATALAARVKALGEATKVARH